MRILVYTAVFGKPDLLLDPAVELDGIDLICWTDMEFRGESAYRIVPIQLDIAPSAKRQRYVKILWPSMLEEYDYSLYLDSNVRLKTDPRELVDLFLSDSDILLFRHSTRDCVYEEAKACLRMRKETNRDLVAQQLQKYRSEGYPEHKGLYHGGVIFRRHTVAMLEFAKTWLSEVLEFSGRDQISLPYVIWKTGTKISLFSCQSFRRGNVWFDWQHHEHNPAFRKV